MLDAKPKPQITTAPLAGVKNVGWTITKVRVPTPPKPNAART